MSSAPRVELDRLDPDRVLRSRQSGVVSRAQLRDLGAEPHVIRGLLRRRDLVAVHPGVYVDHTGPLTWAQRSWAAVLVHWPAALARESALPNGPGPGPIHVAIGRTRTVTAVPGVVAHRMSHLDARVQWLRSPPAVRIEHATIDVAASLADPVKRFGVLADVVGTRRTTASAIAEALRARRGVPDRASLLGLLDDLVLGASSVLEREYLSLERCHGLPVPSDGSSRQRAAVVHGARIYRDVDHAEFGLVVELDGRGFHEGATARDRDAERDLVAAVEDRLLTVRLTYGQVFGHGCRTVAQVARLLQRGGWTGSLVACPDC